MMTVSEIKAAWIPCWQMLPLARNEVAVLVALSDGTFRNDIGTYWGPGEAGGWTSQFWNDRPRVAAWFPLPEQPAKDTTP